MRRRKEVAVTATFSPARRKRFGRRIYSLATIEPGSDGSHSANPERNDQTDCGESKPECDANSSLHCAPRALCHSHPRRLSHRRGKGKLGICSHADGRVGRLEYHLKKNLGCQQQIRVDGTPCKGLHSGLVDCATAVPPNDAGGALQAIAASRARSRRAQG